MDTTRGGRDGASTRPEDSSSSQRTIHVEVQNSTGENPVTVQVDSEGLQGADGVDRLTVSVRVNNGEPACDPKPQQSHDGNPLVCDTCGIPLHEEDYKEVPGAPEIGWEYYECANCSSKVRPVQ